MYLYIGLETARAFLETVKKRHPEISYSDLWILASYVALEVRIIHAALKFTHASEICSHKAICHKI